MANRRRANEPVPPAEPTIIETLSRATKSKAKWTDKVREIAVDILFV